jgi:Zn-dependent protease with chaperone function
MNFYQAQESARKQSKRLVALFCLSVFVLIFLSNALFILFAWISDFGNMATLNRVDVQNASPVDAALIIVESFGWGKVGMITAIIATVIGVATWSKWSELSKGGHVVAEILGGSLVSPDSKDPRERRLLNVVEEMALAAQMLVPPVYILREENGINAFAAGVSADDAVIAVSQGALEQLNREQLQGVVAHEFSHILNGDMRLNVRIVATLHGLLMINETGRMLMHAGSGFGRRRSSFGRSSDDKNGGAVLVFLAGLLVWLLGATGQFFGAVIKAALSRQREYLADASAVQFTRNPVGIAGALRIIGGYGKQSRVDNPHAYELGHIFFCNAFHSRVFATHPPLDERIERLMPNWNGSYLESTADAELRHEGAMGFASSGSSATSTDIANTNGHATNTIDYVPAGAMVEGANTETIADETAAAKTALPERDISHLLQLVHASDNARAVFFAFIDHSSVATGEWVKHLDGLNLSQKLDLLRAAIPALKSQDKDDYTSFRQAFMDAVSRDKKRSLKEWLAYELFRNPCDIHFGMAKAPTLKYRKLESISGFYRLVLARFISMGTEGALRQDALLAAKEASGIDIGEDALNQSVTSKEFTQACYELKRAFPLLKPRILKGLLAAAHADEEFCETEQQLISVLAAIWDLPLPALLASES